MSKNLGGRPKKMIDLRQLKELMRVHPTLKDTANFFDVSEDIIELRIKEEWGISFPEFREQNTVHTRLSVVRKIIQKALAGDNAMLIWYSKNKLGWADKFENKIDHSLSHAVEEVSKLTKPEQIILLEEELKRLKGV